VRDADRIIGLVEAAEKPKPTLILNRLRPGMVKRGDMLATEDVLEILAIDLIGIVPEDEGIITATNRGNPVAFEERAPAGQAYGRIAQRLMGEDVPFPVFQDNTGLMQRVQNWFRSSNGGGGA
jgi:septum site-determining protein MinD